MKIGNTAFFAVVLALGLTACTSARKSDENIGDGTDLVASNDLPSDTDKIAPPLEEDAPKTQQKVEAAPEPEKAIEAKKDEPAAPVQSQPAAGESSGTSYTIQKGDTLMKIAYKKYGDLYQWRKILDFNNDVIGGMKQLSEGTVIKLDSSSMVSGGDRNGERILIKMGDTLGSISDDVYGTKRKWRKIWDNNKPLVKDPNRIYAGFFLYYLMSEQDKVELVKYQQEKGGDPSHRLPASQ